MRASGAWLWCLSLLVRLDAAAGASAPLRQGMPNVCLEQEMAMVAHQRPCVQAFTRFVKTWKQDCGVQRWCVSHERRTGYYTIYKQVYSMELHTVFKCCPGWVREKDDEPGCLHVSCSIGTCFNGGKCYDETSQVCQCPEGYQGPRCQYGQGPIKPSNRLRSPRWDKLLISTRNQTTAIKVEHLSSCF